MLFKQKANKALLTVILLINLSESGMNSKIQRSQYHNNSQR